MKRWNKRQHTAALLEVQSCTRQLHVGSCLTRDLEAALVDESNTTATELDKLQGTNKVLCDELRHVRKQLQEEEARVVKVEKEQAEIQKKEESLEEKHMIEGRIERPKLACVGALSGGYPVFVS
jgi:hypothetical protein